MVRNSQRLGVTVIEAVVVIGILGLLAGILLPAVQRVRERAARHACQNNLRQIGLAAQNYHAAHGRMPASVAPIPRPRRSPSYMQWTHLLLPHLEQATLYAQCVEALRAEPNPYKNPPHAHLTTVVRVYVCPLDGRLTEPITDAEGYTGAYASYFGNLGTLPNPLIGRANGAFDAKLESFTDGTSQTLFVGERPAPGVRLSGTWYGFGYLPEWGYDVYSRHLAGLVDWPPYSGGCQKPIHFGPGRFENPCDSHHFWSLHTDGANFAFADGSVRFLTYSANPIIPALATRDGSERVAIPE
jgi:prepilin-type processing-associated H-X9-DG protein